MSIQTIKGAFTVVLIFAFLGPLLGTLPFVVPMFILEYINKGGMIWPLVLIAGLAIGLLPGMLTGISFVIAVRYHIRHNSTVSKKRVCIYGAVLGLLVGFVLKAIFLNVLFNSSDVLILGLCVISGSICGVISYPLTKTSSMLPTVAGRSKAAPLL